MVLTTDHQNEKSYWGLISFDPVRYVVRYARVTPTSRFGFVEVSCENHEQEKTRATITYTFTALTEAGKDYLVESFTGASHRHMIDSWQTEINAYLVQVQK